MPGAETLNDTVKRNAKFPWLFALHPQQPCSLSESRHLLLQRAVVVRQPQVGHVAQMALLPGKCGVCSPLWGCSLLSLSPFHTASLERGEWILMLPTIFSRVHWGWKHKVKLGEIPGVQITMGWLEGRLDWCLMKYGISASGCFLSLACLLPDWQGPGFLQSCCAWPLSRKKRRWWCQDVQVICPCSCSTTASLCSCAFLQTVPGRCGCADLSYVFCLNLFPTYNGWGHTFVHCHTLVYFPVHVLSPPLTLASPVAVEQWQLTQTDWVNTARHLPALLPERFRLWHLIALYIFIKYLTMFFFYAAT